jgi:hypothetical protein
MLRSCSYEEKHSYGKSIKVFRVYRNLSKGKRAFQVVTEIFRRKNID